MKILMILTSHDQLGNTGEKTGFWLEEFAAPYYVFKDAGAEMMLASPKGGQPPIDPKSSAPDAQTDATNRFNDDAEAKADLASTHALAEVDASGFDAVFYPGGHGPLWDLANDPHSVAIIETALADGKPVGAVCHAPAVFKNVKAANGAPMVKDKSVTGYTNSEEAAVNLTDIVPFLVEDMLNERGARYTKSDDFAEYVVDDGMLVTGQNPASSAKAAQRVLEKLGVG